MTEPNPHGQGGVVCMECGKPYDESDPEYKLWVALGPEGVRLDEALVYCGDCWSDE